MHQFEQRLAPEQLSAATLEAMQQLQKAASNATSNWYMGSSDIQGKGVFAARDMEPGDVVGVAGYSDGRDEYGALQWNLTALARYCNHQGNRNVDLCRMGDRCDLVAYKPIEADSELVADYAQVARELGPQSRMLWEGKDVPTEDLQTYTEKESA